MTCTDPAAGLLPFLVNGTLGPKDQQSVEAHVASCPECGAEAALWQDVSAAVRAEAARLPGASDRAWQRLASRQRASTWPSRLRHVADLAAAQVRLVRHGLWLSSAIVIATGFAVGWAVGRTAAVSALAPLVAVFGVSCLHGPQHDPAYEMASATPTSPRLVLLARLVLVFGYDLALALAASAALSVVMPGTVLGDVVGAWLAPMAFLSALALICSVAIGSQAAMWLAFGLWLLKGAASGTVIPVRTLEWLAVYQWWWTRSSWLFVVAALLSACGIWLAGRREPRLPSVA